MGNLGICTCYEYTGNLAFKDQAIYGFNLTYSRGWDNMLGGGFLWSIKKEDKSPLSNSPAVITACYLYEFTKNVTYLNLAKSIYTWTRSYLCNSATGEVWGDLKADGTVDKSTAIFNSGALGGAANYLYQLTGEISYFDDAKITFDRVITNMCNGGRLSAGTRQGTDLAEYIRYLGDYAHQNYLWNNYYSFMKRNANLAWSMLRTDSNITWNDWTKQTPIDNIATVLECKSAAVIQQVTPVLQTVTAKVEAENFNFMKGVTVQENASASNGKVINTIKTGDWLELIVYVPLSGTYTINYKVVAGNDGLVSLQLNGKTINTTILPATIELQTWDIINTTATWDFLFSVKLLFNSSL